MGQLSEAEQISEAEYRAGVPVFESAVVKQPPKLLESEAAGWKDSAAEPAAAAKESGASWMLGD